MRMAWLRYGRISVSAICSLVRSVMRAILSCDATREYVGPRTGQASADGRAGRPGPQGPWGAGHAVVDRISLHLPELSAIRHLRKDPAAGVRHVVAVSRREEHRARRGLEASADRLLSGRAHRTGGERVRND